MKYFILLFFTFSSLSSIGADQTNIADLIKTDNIVKINTTGEFISSKPSIINKITQSSNLQKQLDVQHQERIIEMTLETKRTEQKPDGTIIVTETKPSSATLEAITQNKQNYQILKDATNNIGFATLLFKSLGGL